MRLSATLLILGVGFALSVAIWKFSGGTFGFFFLPLVFGIPFLWKRSGRRD